MTAAELAEKTGLKERWVLEWARAQAAANLLTYQRNEEGAGQAGETGDGKDRFELTDAGAQVFANEEDSLVFAAGAFEAPIGPKTAEKIAEAFQTGIGLSYQDLGPNAVHRTERMLGHWVRQALVPHIIPALDDVGAKLEAGRFRAGIQNFGANLVYLSVLRIGTRRNH